MSVFSNQGYNVTNFYASTKDKLYIYLILSYPSQDPHDRQWGPGMYFIDATIINNILICFLF